MATEQELEAPRLLDDAQKSPGIQELVTLYSHYLRIEDVATPVRNMMRRQSISSVSNGAYPALPR